LLPSLAHKVALVPSHGDFFYHTSFSDVEIVHSFLLDLHHLPFYVKFTECIAEAGKMKCTGTVLW
jgi:hypothetical protein